MMYLLLSIWHKNDLVINPKTILIYKGKTSGENQQELVENIKELLELREII